MKATIFLSTLAAFASTALAHDGHDDHTTGVAGSTWTTEAPSSTPSIVPSTYNTTFPTTKSVYGNHTLGYNATTTAKQSTSTKLYTSKTPETTSKSAPSTTRPPSTTPTSGASRSEFAMVVLGLAVAAGLVV